MAKYAESQEEFRKLQGLLRKAADNFQMCKQKGGSNILPSYLPEPQPVLLDMRIAGAEGASEGGKSGKVVL